MKGLSCLFSLCSIMLLFSGTLHSEPVDPVDSSERCAVCGMMVAKYNSWITQIHAAGQKPVLFDGVKDMMAYYFNPSAYSGAGDMSSAEIWVKDYYTLEWLDGREAIYVAGSDVMGPMGEEFIPFVSQDAAMNFMKDHKGQQILAFTEITPEMVMQMKKKHMMKMKNMNKANNN